MLDINSKNLLNMITETFNVSQSCEPLFADIIKVFNTHISSSYYKQCQSSLEKKNIL
jgi:hypothetical protein